MNRRGFLKSCLALAAAPAIMSVAKPMKLWTPPRQLIVPSAIPDGEVVVWGAQLEAGFTNSERLFSTFMKIGDGPTKRVSMRAMIPAGVAPNVVIRKDGTIDIEGGVNKTTVETEYPKNFSLGSGGYPLTSDYISQPVAPMSDNQIYQPLIAGNYVMTADEHTAMIKDDIVFSGWLNGSKE